MFPAWGDVWTSFSPFFIRFPHVISTLHFGGLALLEALKKKKKKTVAFLIVMGVLYNHLLHLAHPKEVSSYVLLKGRESGAVQFSEPVFILIYLLT